MLELSLQESLDLGHELIGTEHILLGLARENEGVATRILLDLGVDSETIREELARWLSGGGPAVPLEVRERIKEARAKSEREGAGSAYRVRQAVGPHVPLERERRAFSLTPFVAGAATFAAGLLVGWAIWG